MASQIASQIAKTFVEPSTSFFLDGGKDTGRILSKPDTATSLHPKEVIMVEEEVVDLWKQKVLRSVQGGQMEEVENVPRGGRLKIFSQRWCVLGAEYLVKANIYEQTPSRKILERKYPIQGTKRRWRLWTRK
jgi:hypothetical protein